MKNGLIVTVEQNINDAFTSFFLTGSDFQDIVSSVR